MKKNEEILMMISSSQNTDWYIEDKYIYIEYIFTNLKDRHI